MRRVPPFAAFTLILLLTACTSTRPPTCESPSDVRIFEAANIGEQWIDYVWFELPAQIGQTAGSTGNSAATPDCPSCERPAWGITAAPLAASAIGAQGRLFVASADPVGAIVPTMLDLPCAKAPVDYAPVPVDLQLSADDSFKASYAWKSCAACSECYMHWTFSLDITGRVEQDVLHADLVLNETFHSGPMKLITLEMADVTPVCTQPRIQCEPSGACEDIRFEGRP